MYKNKKRWLPAAVAMLASAVVMLLIYSRAQAGRLQALQNAVDASYERAFYETASLMNDIEIDLQKAQVTGSEGRRQALLARVSRAAALAQSQLGALPDTLASVTESLKFVNQTGDIAATLADRLAAGGETTQADLELLARLHGSCVSLNNLIGGILAGVEAGGLPLSSGAMPADGETELDNAPVEYPVLLYDGPFSDGRPAPSLDALGGEAVSAEEALAAARAFIGADRVNAAWVAGEGDVPAPCYEITAHVAEGLLSLAVTRQGGHILYMMLDGRAGPAAHSHASLIDRAAAFLKSRGYPDMVVSYWVAFGGLLTANFAPVQDGVVLYPDLVKVQMSMETGMPVGLEAANYLANHVARSLSAPALSADEARARLNPALETGRARLCLIPLDSGEALCYEFAASLDGADYLIYIDALTGEERNIYRVLEDDNGTLVV